MNNKYRVTGRDPNKATLIEQEIKSHEPEYTHLRDIIGKKTQPVGGTNGQSRKFFLESDSGGRYAEQGRICYFGSKKQAKRVRNVLNRRNGAGSYRIQRMGLEALKEEPKVQDLFPEKGDDGVPNYLDPSTWSGSD